MRNATPRQFKEIQPYKWYGHYSYRLYITHLLTELGRLDLYGDIGSPAASLLSDLLDFTCDHRNEAPLYDWQKLNLKVLSQRASKQQFVARIKPRINIHADITSKGNLSVLWYPTNWRDIWSRDQREIDCDFLAFDDNSAAFARPSNELMFIHGVRNLRPGDSNRDYGLYLRYNKWVLDELLICAVRAAYEKLIDRLNETFNVTVRAVFVFEERNDRVVDWKLEDPEVMQRDKDQSDLAAVEENFGLPLEVLEEHVQLVNDESIKDIFAINQKLARNLKKAGYKITPARVGQLRDLLSRCRAGHGVTND